MFWEHRFDHFESNSECSSLIFPANFCPVKALSSTALDWLFAPFFLSANFLIFKFGWIQWPVKISPSENSHKYKKGKIPFTWVSGQRARRRDGKRGPDLRATQTDYLLPLEEFNYAETDLEWVIDPAVSVRSQNNLFLTLLLEIEDENFLKAPNKIVWRWGAPRWFWSFHPDQVFVFTASSHPDWLALYTFKTSKNVLFSQSHLASTTWPLGESLKCGGGTRYRSSAMLQAIHSRPSPGVGGWVYFYPHSASQLLFSRTTCYHRASRAAKATRWPSTGQRDTKRGRIYARLGTVSASPQFNPFPSTFYVSWPGFPIFLTRDRYTTDQPEVEVERSWVHSGEGFEAQLVCIVHADPPADVSMKFWQFYNWTWKSFENRMKPTIANSIGFCVTAGRAKWISPSNLSCPPFCYFARSRVIYASRDSTRNTAPRALRSTTSGAKFPASRTHLHLKEISSRCCLHNRTSILFRSCGTETRCESTPPSDTLWKSGATDIRWFCGKSRRRISGITHAWRSTRWEKLGSQLPWLGSRV